MTAPIVTVATAGEIRFTENNMYLRGWKFNGVDHGLTQNQAMIAVIHHLLQHQAEPTELVVPAVERAAEQEAALWINIAAARP